MKTIFKYELKPVCHQNLTEPVMVPHDAKYLHVGSQGEQMFIWAEVDTESSVIEHNFEVFSTGSEMQVDMGVDRSHIGSLMMYDGSLVFHVYHRIN